MDENINNSIKNLIQSFEEIKKLGYIKSINNNYSGIGLTFEKLLGKDFDNFSFPDYNMIELKTKLTYSRTPIHLFSLSPEGKEFFEVKRLWENYGHVGYKNKKFKQLNNKVLANILMPVGKKYYFTLKVDHNQNKIVLLIYNANRQLIDNYTYWDFTKIKEALERKFKYLAIIEVYTKNINNEKYYKYWKINIYKLKSFEKFIELIEKGEISISFCVGIYKSENKYGQMHDHGTNFEIYKEKIQLLFQKIY